MRSTRSMGACWLSIWMCRSAENPLVSPGSAVKLRTTTLRASVAASACTISGTSRCGITLLNHDPGPRVTTSAESIALRASRPPGGWLGINRTRRTDPGVVATATWPRTRRMTRGSSSSPATSASMSRGCSDMGTTRPCDWVSCATVSRAAM